MIHHSHDISGELLHDAYDLASLGITVFVPGLSELAGMPRPFVPGTGRDIQKKVGDPQSLDLLRRSWRFLLAQDIVDEARVGVMGYCMGGRLGLHFVASEPSVRCFGTYYPSIKEEAQTELRPVQSIFSAAALHCPTFVVFGGQDRIVSNEMQMKIWQTLLGAVPRLEWHFFSEGRHGFAAPPSAGFQQELARRARPLKFDFLHRELA